MQKIEAGVGRVVLRSHGSDAVFEELSYKYPLKLLSPQVHEPKKTAVVYVLSYGGGLVGGDTVRLSCEVHDESTLVMLTQGSTKVFKTRPGQRLARTHTSSETDLTSQHLTVQVSPGSTLILLPDPVTCFRSAKYDQLQKFHLAADSSAVLLDWLTSGRKSLGEDWAFTRYYSLNEVWVDGKRIARDPLLLEEDTTTIDSLPPRTLAERLKPYSCYATVLLYGPVTYAITRALAAEFAEITVFQQNAKPPLLWSISEICDGKGSILRIGGLESEEVRNWLGRALRPLEAVVGTDIYRRVFA